MEQNKEQKPRKPFNLLEGCAWPDPDPSSAAVLEVNDVSQLSATAIHRVVFPRTEADVLDILHQARSDNKHVSIRGTKHSMGGHCMTENGYVMDTAYLNHLEYNPDKEIVTAGPGCTWANVIQLLNKYGKSPRVMQSYCSFSVGGTLAVNAHGITSDETLASCVVSFRLACFNNETNKVEVITCTRPNDNTKSSREENLFGLALGGYGLFGVITQVMLHVADNSDLDMESLTALSTRREEGCNECEFVRLWDVCRADKDRVDIKLARLNILTLDTASVYVFTKGHGRTISNLSIQPRQLSSWGRLLYKWALPLLKDVRHSREESSGQALDMKDTTNMARNDVLWESALPLAKLYSPLVVLNDTFLLQEYFVPHDAFCKWIEATRPIFKDIDEYQRRGSFDEDGEAVAAQSLTLLNTTIRYVEEDTTTFLKYSTVRGGMFAFVLYFRIKRTPEVEHDLGGFHNRVAKAAIDLGGTFYLPYRKCYDQHLLSKGYPQIKDFAALKERYDPLCLFSSQWFEHYVLPLCSSDYQSTFHSACSTSLVGSSVPLGMAERNMVPSEAEFMKWLPRVDDPLLERRTNSFRALLKDKELCKHFSEEFLVNVFNLAVPSEVMRVMRKAAWDPRNQDDVAIYKILLDHFQGSTELKPLAALQQGWRGIRQLSHQKTELCHETAMILHLLGKFGHIRDYLSIGDHGKTVRNFRQIGLLGPRHETRVIVAHNFHPENDEVSLHAILERGSMHPVGDLQIQFDYLDGDAGDAFNTVPSASIDLITLNQGLHHFRQNKLYSFLCEVKRMLRPRGVFIFREHDLDLKRSRSRAATSSPVAMLDLAHSVFNAVTGASEEEEAREIRAFRPLSEWRSMVEKIGLVDSLLYGLEEGDCTSDFMLCFSKADMNPQPIYQSLPPSAAVMASKDGLGDEEPPMMASIRALLAQVPATGVGVAETIVEKLLQMLPSLLKTLSKFLLVDLPKAVIDDERQRQSKSQGDAFCGDLLNSQSIIEFAEALENYLRTKLERVIEIGFSANDLLRDICIRETTNIAGLLNMPELFLVLPLLKRKMTLYPNQVGEAEKRFLNVIENLFPVLLEVGDTCMNSSAPSPSPTICESLRGDSVQKPVALDEPVDKYEVLQVINDLGEAIPGLLDPAVVLAESGFNLSQQSALVGSLAAPDLVSFAGKVAGYHDQQSWQHLRWILVGDPSGIAKVQSVAASGELPTKERLFSTTLNHPWHNALKAFLRGPHIRLKQQAIFGLRMIDLGNLVVLYDEVKEMASREQSEEGMGRNSALSYPKANTLSHLMDKLSGEGEIREVRIQFEGLKTYDLYDVAEVLKAEFGYKSLTSSLTDITNDVRALHAEVHSRSHPLAPPGWLPVRENMLTGFRNKGGASKMGDSLRKVVVGTGSLGLAGNNVLKLTYMVLQTTGMSTDKLEAANELCEYAEQKKLINAYLHPNDGHYTWFKLTEWMQVEMMEVFAKSLDHTPWYQFPFFEFLSTYFFTLFKECEIVQSEHGLLEAYGSIAFATDFVPGLVMSFLFAQMKLLSVPLKLSLPSYDPNIMTEEILMTASLVGLKGGESLLGYLRNMVDDRIRDASLLCQSNLPPSKRLFRIIVPTFKTMGEVLVKLGEHIPSAMILQISNQTVVQVLLQVNGTNVVESFVTRINSVEGLQVMFQYQFPMDSQLHREQGEFLTPTVNVSVKAQVTSLLVLTRLVAQLDERVEVKQIYDFWSG